MDNGQLGERMAKCVLAIDIGGSKFMVGLVSSEGEILCKERRDWNANKAEDVVRELKAAADALLSKADQKPEAIGITIPGLSDPKTGTWVEASFSCIRDIPIARIFADRYQLPAFADNDAKAAALAEKRFGSCRDASDFLYITVSNGIGGAIFMGGHLQYGAYGNAGEIGHCVVVDDGRPCKCGQSGCLEMYAAGPGIIKTYEELGGKGQMDGKALADLARGGDTLARRCFDLEGFYLGKAIGLAANILNPAKVVLGGGLSLAFDIYEEPLRASMKRHMYGKANENIDIAPVALKYDGGFLGAAAVALRGLHQENF